MKEGGERDSLSSTLEEQRVQDGRREVDRREVFFGGEGRESAVVSVGGGGSGSGGDGEETGGGLTDEDWRWFEERGEERVDDVGEEGLDDEVEEGEVRG